MNTYRGLPSNDLLDSVNCLQNLISNIVRKYLIQILLYLTINKVQINPETQNGKAHDHKK